MTKRYFDVNVFVYYLTGDNKNGKIAYNWIKDTEERLTSVITPFEVAVILSKLLNTDLRDVKMIRRILQAFKELGVRFLPMDWDDVLKIAENYKLDLEDAIHVSAALKEKAEIVSADKELQKKANARF